MFLNYTKLKKKDTKTGFDIKIGLLAFVATIFDT